MSSRRKDGRPAGSKREGHKTIQHHPWAYHEDGTEKESAEARKRRPRHDIWELEDEVAAHLDTISTLEKDNQALKRRLEFMQVTVRVRESQVERLKHLSGIGQASGSTAFQRSSFVAATGPRGGPSMVEAAQLTAAQAAQAAAQAVAAAAFPADLQGSSGGAPQWQPGAGGAPSLSRMSMDGGAQQPNGATSHTGPDSSLYSQASFQSKPEANQGPVPHNGSAHPQPNPMSHMVPLTHMSTHAQQTHQSHPWSQQAPNSHLTTIPTAAAQAHKLAPMGPRTSGPAVPCIEPGALDLLRSMGMMPDTTNTPGSGMQVETEVAQWSEVQIIETYKRTSSELSPLLFAAEDTSSPDAPAAACQLTLVVTTIKQLGALAKVLNPAMVRAASQPVSTGLDQASEDHWESVAAALLLSPQQVDNIVLLNDLRFKWLRRILQDHVVLSSNLNEILKEASSQWRVTWSEGQVRKAELMNKLHRVIGAERWVVVLVDELLTETLLDTMQVARCLVHSYPYVPDACAIVEAVDRMHRKRMAAAEAKANGTTSMTVLARPGRGASPFHSAQ